MSEARHEQLSHGDDCRCTRCVGFQPGNEVAVKHGAYASPVRLAPRAEEIADAIRPLVPAWSVAFEPTLALFATSLVRMERATAALDGFEAQADERGVAPLALYGQGADELRRLRQDLRGWISTCARLADALGLTPSAQARIMRDAGIGRSAAGQAEDRLRAHLHERYGGDCDG